MNFEIFDNFFQVSILLLCTVGALVFGFQQKSRAGIILAFGYGCFGLGTLFYVLHLSILGYVPQISYVAEISWLAAYLFFLSLELLRREDSSLSPAPLPVIAGLLTAAAAIAIDIFGPSPLIVGLFALTAGSIVYLVLLPGARRPFDRLLAACVGLQLLLYFISCFMTDFTRFNLYFAADILLTLSLAALLPLTIREARHDLH